MEKPKDKITRETFGVTGTLPASVYCEKGAEQSQERLVNEAIDLVRTNFGLDTEIANLGQCSGDVAKTDENGNTVYSKANFLLRLKNGK